VTVTFSVNSNNSVAAVASSGIFANAVVGDTVFIPGPTTGDTATVFAVENEGFWTVIQKNSTTSVVLARPTGTSFSALAEAQVCTSNSQLKIFSSDNVQVGDSIDIVDGFSSTIQDLYSVVAVTDTWVEVLSSQVLPTSETATPSDSGVRVYNYAQRFVYVETNQPVVVRPNGDTGDTNRVTPWEAGDTSAVGHWVTTGPVFKLVVVNKSLANATVKVIAVK
jgi:hypothetical protein